MMRNGKHPILVVDDEPEILDSLFGLLRMEFDVHTAESGQEALDVLKRQKISVVMTDQRMPEMTGVELLNLLEGKWPDAIRIVFTGYADVKAVIDAINEGHIYRYITKPWDPDELRAVLRQAVDEYEQIVERRRLLTDLRGHQERTVGLAQALCAGDYGPLAPEGRQALENLCESGGALLKRLDRVLAAGPGGPQE